MESGGDLDVALKREEAASFHDALLHGLAEITLTTSKIDTRNAVASYERDRAMIADAVTNSANGFEAVNGTIHGCLRSWYAAEARTLHRRCVDVLGNDHSDTFHAGAVLAALLSNQGKLSEAEPLYREVLRGRRAMKGNDDRATLRSVKQLANVLEAQGKLDCCPVGHVLGTGRVRRRCGVPSREACASPSCGACFSARCA